jgi:hypothetical protein
MDNNNDTIHRTATTVLSTLDAIVEPVIASEGSISKTISSSKIIPSVGATSGYTETPVADPSPGRLLTPTTAFLIFIGTGVGMIIIYVLVLYCMRYYHNRKLMTNGRYKGVLVRAGTASSEGFGSLGSVNSAFEMDNIKIDDDDKP